MLRALATTLGALDAASELDVDRSDEDRQFFATERDALQPQFDGVQSAAHNVETHALLVGQKMQARVVVGDAVLDRGVSKAKARMKVELRDLRDNNQGADHVFGANVGAIINAEREKEPQLVLAAVERMADVPSFSGKTEMAADLTGRAGRQRQALTARDDARLIEAKLDSALSIAIGAAADALYALEKRLLQRFPRDTTYVRAFFLDCAPARTKKTDATKTDADEGKPPKP